MLTKRTRQGALATALLAITALAPATAQAAKPDVTVMSRNLYLGADIIKLAAAQNANDLQNQVQAVHQIIDQTNFPLRAKAIAAEVKSTKPDVINLQEVTTIYRGADGVHDGVKNSTTVLYDWMKSLQTELKAKGLKYKVASRQTSFDVETASAEGYDLRLKYGDAVLVKTGKGSRVKVKKGFTGTFTDQLNVPLADGQTAKLTRGWAGIQGVVAGKRFIDLDPHAEAYSDDIATNQFKELLKRAAKSKKVATIIAGDFNSDPTAPGAKAGGYNAVKAAGFKDTSPRVNTCCQNETVNNNPSTLSQWIDHIVVRPKAKVLKHSVVGNQLSDMIGGLWPSDHAGVVATLRLK